MTQPIGVSAAEPSVYFRESHLAKLPKELWEHIFEQLRSWEIPQAVVSFSLVATDAHEIVQCFSPRMAKTNQVTFCNQLWKAEKGRLTMRLVPLPLSALCRDMSFLQELKFIGFMHSGNAVYYNWIDSCLLVVQPFSGEVAVLPTTEISRSLQIRGFIALDQKGFVVIEEEGLIVFDGDKKKLFFHRLIPTDEGECKILDGSRSGDFIFLLIAKIDTLYCAGGANKMTLEIKFDLTTRSYTSKCLEDSCFVKSVFRTEIKDYFPINFIAESQLCVLSARLWRQGDMDKQLQSHSNLTSLEHTKNIGASIDLGRQVYQLHPDGSLTLFASIPSLEEEAGEKYLFFYKNKTWLVCVSYTPLFDRYGCLNVCSSSGRTFLHVFTSEGKIFYSIPIPFPVFIKESSVCIKHDFLVIGNLHYGRFKLMVVHIPTKKIMRVEKCGSYIKPESTLHGLDLIEKDDGTYQLLVFLACKEQGPTPLVYQVEFPEVG